jgi:hypothetical protein
VGRVRAVPRLCELYPGIWLTAEEKARKNLSQGGDDPDDRPAVNKTKCLLLRSSFVLAFLYKFYVEVSVCLYFGRKLPGTTLPVLTLGLWKNASRLNVFSANFASFGTEGNDSVDIIGCILVTRHFPGLFCGFQVERLVEDSQLGR